MKLQEIKQRYDALESLRKTPENTWDLIEKFILPMRGGKFFNAQTSEHEIDWRRGRDIFDSTAILAANTLASSVHGALTNPAIRWFNYRFRQKPLNDIKEAIVWLQTCGDLVWYALQESDFNLQINEAYQDLVGFGNSCITEEAEDETSWKGLDFSTLPLREIYFEPDHKGRVYRFYRRHQWTALQILSKFGADGVPEHIKEKAKAPNQADQKITVIMCIYPRPAMAKADTTKQLMPKKRPYGVKWILHSTVEQLGEEGGYYEMPAFLPRWQKASGSMWGFGPGHIALSDTMTLNTMVEQRLAAASKVIDPTTLVTERGLMSDLDLEPGGQTVVRDMNSVKAYESGARFDVADNLIMGYQERINEIFMVDRLELKESPAMTATEVNARFELMQRLLGPVFGRLQTDLLDPLIERTFRIMLRAGQLPEMPDVVQDFEGELEVDYIGPMARAQKSDTVGVMAQWMGMMAEFSEMYPKLNFLPDEEAFGRESAKALNVPATLVRSVDEYKDRVDQDDQNKLQERQLAVALGQGQALTELGKGAKNFADAGAPIQ